MLWLKNIIYALIRLNKLIYTIRTLKSNGMLCMEWLVAIGTRLYRKPTAEVLFHPCQSGIMNLPREQRGTTRPTRCERRGPELLQTRSCCRLQLVSLP